LGRGNGIISLTTPLYTVKPSSFIIFVIVEEKIKPIFNKRIFWDVNFEQIDYDAKANFVIERVFERGDVEVEEMNPLTTSHIALSTLEANVSQLFIQMASGFRILIMVAYAKAPFNLC
jgi:hypothetical protein